MPGWRRRGPDAGRRPDILHRALAPSVNSRWAAPARLAKRQDVLIDIFYTLHRKQTPHCGLCARTAHLRAEPLPRFEVWWILFVFFNRGTLTAALRAYPYLFLARFGNSFVFCSHFPRPCILPKVWILHFNLFMSANELNQNMTTVAAARHHTILEREISWTHGLPRWIF